MTSPGSFASFAPGKVILLGEHGVVYGQPALAAPLSWGVTARGASAARCSLELPSQLRGLVRGILQTAFQRAARLCGQPKIQVRLESDLPPSMGLGSSAAVSVACAKLLLNASGRSAKSSEVLRIAGEMERVFHGNPSGVDHTCSAQGRMILFRRANGGRAARVRQVRSQRPVKILVALVGNRQSTRLTVAGLAERHARWPIRYQRIFKEMGRVVEEGARAVEIGDLEALGDAMHHRILQPFVMQHGGIDKGGELRLAADDVFRLLAHAIPDRIERRQLRTLWIDLMHGHVLLSQVRLISTGIIARRADGCP